MSSNAPPASPKRRRRGWQPPSSGTGYIHDQDGTIWRVYQIDRASQHVCLRATIGTGRKWVNAADLAAEYTLIEAAA